MLDELPTQRRARRVFRLAKDPTFDFLTSLGLDSRAAAELREALAAAPAAASAEQLCEAVFRPKRRLRRRTRYSDGSFPAFYSSLNVETAEAEVKRWLPVVMGRPTTARTTYYRRLECTFSGREKDLRGQVSEWPDLVHETDYTFCNGLGAEARELGLDGLVVPSARHAGANLPIFRRAAIAEADLGDAVAVTYAPDSGAVSFDEGV